MARVRKTMELIQRSEGCINEKYDLYVENIRDIKDESANLFDMIINSFRLDICKAGRLQRQRCGKVVQYDE